MNLSQILLAELQRESVNTRKLLEKVPEEQFNWQPHPKSMTLTHLVTHIAEIPGMFIAEVLQTEELNITTNGYKKPSANNATELLNLFDLNLKKAEQGLQEATDEDLIKNWVLRNDDHIILTLPKRAVIRNLSLNHVVHHRGQLSVFLRLLNIPVPGMYGPSADDIF